MKLAIIIVSLLLLSCLKDEVIFFNTDSLDSNSIYYDSTASDE